MYKYTSFGNKPLKGLKKICCLNKFIVVLDSYSLQYNQFPCYTLLRFNYISLQ